jgi:hypothetical protein
VARSLAKGGTKNPEMESKNLEGEALDRYIVRDG